MAAPPPNASTRRGLSTRTKWVVGCSIGALLPTLVGVGVAWNILSCEQVLCSGPSPEAIASANAEQAALVASYGGPPPANCGNGPVPLHPKVVGTIWAEDHAYLGRAQVWLEISELTVENGRAVLHMEHSGIKKEAGGFPIYLEWITNADFAGSINVRITDAQSGVEVRSDPAVYMHDPNLLVASEARVIDLDGTPYRIFVTFATFPAVPGCYVVMATWPGDSWSVSIAIGR